MENILGSLWYPFVSRNKILEIRELDAKGASVIVDSEKRLFDMRNTRHLTKGVHFHILTHSIVNSP